MSLTIHLERSLGSVRAIHGVNLGPVDRHYALDHTEYFRRAKIPSVRTHDCNRSLMDVVDLHYIFPDPEADPEEPGNYRFTLTDDYLKKIHQAGASVYFRLGESIEGRYSPRKTYVVAARWKPEILARVCVNIARHYTEAWADGFEWSIPHWQFWNEPNNQWMVRPENRPCWTGTVEQFYALYEKVACAMKKHNSSWHVGLAGFGRPWFVFPKGHHFYQEENPWRAAEPLLNTGPIDSISWHQYGASWEDLAATSQMVRRFLDQHGLSRVESHITEWNYMPWLEDEKGKYTWFHARQERDFDRLDRICSVMCGIEGAAYIFGALARLQDEKVDLTHLYTATSGGALGLFNHHGRPYKKYAGLEVFSSFLGESRVALEKPQCDEIGAMVTKHGEKLRIGISHLKPKKRETTVYIPGIKRIAISSSRQIRGVGWEDLDLGVSLQGGGVVLQIPSAESGISIIEGELLYV